MSINLAGDTFLIQSELLSVGFLGVGKARVLRVKLTSLSKVENKEQTQSTFGAKAWTRTHATLVVHSPLRHPPLQCICTRQRSYLLQFCGNLEAKRGYFLFYAHYDVLFPCLKKMEFFLFATNSGSVFYTAFAVKTEDRWVLFLKYMNHSSSLFTVFFFYFVWI